jgi:hypothetical protein
LGLAKTFALTLFIKDDPHLGNDICFNAKDYANSGLVIKYYFCSRQVNRDWNHQLYLE